MHSTLWLSILVGYILGAMAAALVLPPAAIEAVAPPVGLVTCMLVTATVVAVLVERTRPAALELTNLATAPLAAAGGGAPTHPGALRFEWEPAAASPGAGAAWAVPQPVVVWIGPDPEPARPPAAGGAPPTGVLPGAAAAEDDGEALSVEAVRRAVDLGRIEVLARPIVTLPQRRVAAYEGLTQLRDPGGGGLVPPGRYAAAAERAGLSGRIDLAQLRAWARFAARESGPVRRQRQLFWGLSPASVGDPAFIAEAGRFLAGRPALARRLVLAPSGTGLGEAAWPGLLELRRLGVRLSLEPPRPTERGALELARRGVAFVRLGVERFAAAADLSRLDPELIGLVEGFRAAGIEPVVSGIGSERALVEVLDYRVRYGQGPLFGAPESVAA